ncbi:TonB-dependent receptor [Niveispirillum sp. BGYR6]|uniref:TonB-dependent receptor n=1 Tax=Niveispirillum sp. BGYR6 TaxID=2971249 RepID=UPI0022B9716E|nr:TonB-dependent receptor [Niveispirillum sp. BGYR6]MDG5493748.1 TonB-dependent receptor [Niveispirillum sp. BGYR6]
MHRPALKSVLLATAVALAPFAAAHADEPLVLEEILVVATRYQASDAQMQSKNSVAILSNEDLEHTAVHNVAEALGLLPGVTVVNTGQSFFGGIDGAARGEGMFAAVRGMNSEYNVNMINGITVAQGMPYSRGVKLSLLPPSGLHTIALNKTSTPDMDGDAIGGTIDFRTPTAYDFKQDVHASMTVSGRMESRARDYGDSGLGGGTAGDLAFKFGQDDQFGVYVSAYYDKRNYANSQMAGAMAARSDGGWAYALTGDAGGSNSAPGLDPLSNVVQTGVNLGVSNGSTARYGGNLSLDWHPDETLQAYFRASYAFAKTVQNSTFSQIVSTNKGRIKQPSGLYGLDIQKFRTSIWYETNPEKADLSTFQLGAEKKIGAWTISPQLFYSMGNNNRPDHLEASARNDQYSSNDRWNYGGGVSMGYENNFPIPLLTPEMFNALDNAGTALYARRAGQLTSQASGQDKRGGKIDVQHDFDEGSLQYVKFGAKYIDSQRKVTNRDWTNDHFSNLVGGRPTWSSLGIAKDSYDEIFPGKYGWSVPKIDHERMLELFRKYQNAASFDSCGGGRPYVDNMNCNTQKGREAVSSAYVMGQWQLGDLELIPGLRFEHTEIKNTFWQLPASSSVGGNWAKTDTTYNEWLPSIHANWRPDDSSVYRAAVWTSYTRPAFVQLAGGARYDLSDDGVTTITMGNPDLKPIRSLNADLSGEWRSDWGGYASFGGYYKHLSDYLYENGSDGVNAALGGSGRTRTLTPQNGGKGDVYGLELTLRQKFKDLPEPFDGFGIGGNLTRQWTSVDLGNDVVGRSQRIQNAPEWLANAQLFYEYEGFTFDVIYNYTGSYVSVYNFLNQPGTWDNLWVRPTTRLDLHTGYQFEGGFSVDLSVSNLLGDYTYWSHVGKNSLAISDVVDSGTTSLLTIKYTY